ncbi:hypothetical protein UlMin_033227 [Ulmus minor]
MARLRTCDIINLMVHHAGETQHVGFTKKDAYNKLATIECGQNIETDSEGLLGYLTSRIDTIDPNMYVRYAIDDQDRLCHLLWSDGTSQYDYHCFSDALAFNTTYRINAFNKPLVIFVGVNNHFKTCVFSFGLLQNEKTETYVWVLQTFLHCMNGLAPNVVVTDGNNTMKLIIAQCLPGAMYCLCKWHLSTNVALHIKHPQFSQAFKKFLYTRYNIPEWYDKWSALKDNFNLENDEWLADTYERRNQWADAFLRKHFFGGMYTT